MYNYRSGNEYKGQWRNGVREGEGEMVCRGGKREGEEGRRGGVREKEEREGKEEGMEIYKGWWVNGYREGHGTYTWKGTGTHHAQVL